jgi:thiamine-monophosphate kinase
MTISDEPTRVGHLVQRYLLGQSGAQISIENGEIASSGLADVILTDGADKGDDCAVIEVQKPITLVVGSDYVRGPKFILYEIGLLSNYDIGYYVVVANLSDIAAMGATPIGVLTVVRYPGDLTDASFNEIIDGIHQACTDHGTLNIGGDIGNAERIILSGSALGFCRPDTVLRRSGAQPGDVLCVTGPCGLLGAAVAYFPKRETNGWSLPTATEEALLQSWKRPRAKIAEGRLLAESGSCTACQDTSDGLKATIAQLSTASGVGFDVYADAIPIDAAVRAVAELMEVDALTLAMSASSDFQLVFTLAPDAVETCAQKFNEQGLSFRPIGVATEPEQGVRLLNQDGSTSDLPGVAWRHQSGDISTLVVTEQNGAERRSQQYPVDEIIRRS